MKLRAGWMFALLAALALTAGCGGDDGKKGSGGNASNSKDGAKRFIFLINTPNPFWDTCNAGLKEAEKELKLADANLSITMEANDGTAKGQVDKLRQYATQSDIAGVAISPIEANNDAIVEEMKKLQDKGVKVITVDADVDAKLYPDARPYYIGTDNLVAGRQLGTATRAILKERKFDSGGYVHFVGKVENDNAIKRMDGFNETVGKEYSQIDRMADETQISDAQNNVRNAIINHKDKVNCLVGIWAYNGPAISLIVTERKERDKFVCVTFDADAESIKAMEDGQMDCMCVQNPFDMGYQATRLLKAMHEDDQKTIKEMYPNEGQPGGDIYTTGLRIVVPDGSPVKEDMFDAKVVEFMSVKELKDWLDKYGLTSS